MNLLRRCLLSVLTISLLTAAVVRAEEYPRGELLVEVLELSQASKTPGTVVLDARSSKAYSTGHVPGALQVDPAAWKAAFKEGKDTAGWSKRIGDLGVSADSTVIVYDDVALKNAARVWWLLRFWGVKNARLLNGDWTTYVAAKQSISTDASPAPQPVAFAARPQSDRITTTDQMLKLLRGKSLQVIDSRSENEFCGLARAAKRNGAIPGAKHLEWSDLLNPTDRRFKSPSELSMLFKDAGVDLAQPMATHCQSGGRSSVMVFGLELMGAKDVSNYYQGWSEWGNRADTPIKPGEKK